MIFSEILHKIIELKKESRKKSEDQSGAWKIACDTLLGETSDDKKQAVQALLQEIAQNFGVSAESENSVRIHYGSESKTDEGSHVAKLLLPIMKLAYLYENNGIPEEHAAKLSTLFSNIDDALNYLEQFASNAMKGEARKAPKEHRTATDVSVVHDACLFALPSEELHFNFQASKLWKKLISVTNMQDPAFKALLPNAPEIEHYIQEQALSSAQKKKAQTKENQNKLEQAKAAVLNTTKQYKEIRNKRIKGNITTAEEILYNQYGNNLLKAQLDLVKASATLGNLDRLSLLELQAYGAAYKNQTESEFKYFLDKGLTKSDYAKFVKLKRVDNDTEIPPVIIDGQAIAYPGFYLRRLNVENANDAAVAACLGKLTACCQSLSGETGEPCTIHGLTSPLGGFYVVCEGDVNNPNPLEDKVIFQSWVWKSQTKAMVIDSVEAARDARTEEKIEMAKAFYRELAYQLVTNHQIPKICCGDRSGISKRLEMNPESSHRAEIPQDYVGYRDSDRQFMVCAANALYLIPEKKDDFFKECIDQKLAADHPNYIQMLNFAIARTGIESLKKYQQTLLGKYQEIFDLNGKEIVNRCWDMYSKMCEEKSYQDAVKMAYETPYLLDIRNESGDRLLHLIARNPELLSQILSLLPESSRLEAVKEKDRGGSNVLRLAAANPESLRQILSLYPESSRLEAVKEKDKYGSNVLRLTAANPESLRQILSLYPESSRLEAVKEKDNDGSNVLHLAVGNPESLRQILSLLPESSRLEAVKEKDRGGSNVLHLASGNPESLRQILSLYSESSQLEAVKEKGRGGSNVLHLAAGNPESLRQILSLYSESSRLEAVKEKNNYGSNVLHLVAGNPESLRQILSLYSESSRLEAVKEKDRGGSNVLRLAAGNPESLRQILSLYPESSRLEAVKEKNNYGSNLLHLVARNPESLRQILSLYPESSRLEAVKEEDKDGNNLLCLAAGNPESLRQVLSLYPESSRLEALKENNVLRLLARRPESLAQILDLLPVQISSFVKNKSQGDIRCIEKLLTTFGKKTLEENLTQEQPTAGQQILGWQQSQKPGLETKPEDEVKPEEPQPKTKPSTPKSTY